MMVVMFMVINCIIIVLNIFLQTGHLYLHITDDVPVLDQMKEFNEIMMETNTDKAYVTLPFPDKVLGSKSNI